MEIQYNELNTHQLKIERTKYSLNLLVKVDITSKTITRTILADHIIYTMYFLKKGFLEKLVVYEMST